ncbi:hypothetical protein AC578_9258 [Pseudocercospora eumusae]|uniref:Small-subunit processome Utp12 domain-containing protein n=1 Tax=Pseudocercospora eumusae TaxID=321146 RepID=A0A139HNG4_9PEZI|nr:hypothetical protein AC578_9258 [Pseudocercospora eumusae]
MSAAKRLRQRHAEAQATSPAPASKRIKSSHVPSKPNGLDFLVHEEARAAKPLTAKLTNGVARSKTNRVDESHAVVAQDEESDDEEETDEEEKKQQPHEVIEISSADDSSSLPDDDEEEVDPAPAHQDVALVNGHEADAEEQQVAEGAEDLDMDDAEPEEEPTFGEQLQARHPDTIDLQKTQGGVAGNGALVPGGDRRVAEATTAGSLGVVLAQALKTNDKDLLESCFALTDVDAIRATIQRQQSQQIAILLKRLAERVHKRPGRAGKLMIWIQWSLVTHGAYLANQPALMKELKALAQVTRERANGLQPLLHLKGKLDLLSAQLEARRNLQAASKAAHDEDDEDDVLYIEGQERAWSSDEEAEAQPSEKRGKQSAATLAKAIEGGDSDESADEDEVPNGFINGIEDDSSADDDEDEERNGLLDDEAEEASEDESSNDDADSAASSMDEDESSDGEDSEAEAIKQPKPQTLNRKR